MKVTYNWLKEFVDIKVFPKKLADDLSLFGHEVEKIEKIDDDFVFELEITPNRGDCLSVLGLAREISAMYGLKLKIKNYEQKIKEENLDKEIAVKISDTKLCPRYTARIIDNIKIAPSPNWMQKRLKTYGFRPVNNIVDVTNYVMIETGQPLHAFDYNKIKTAAGKKLMHIRQTKKHEEVMTLDGKNHLTNEGALIIEDDKKIYDLAGIMGGFKSEVSQNTKTIILEGAIFAPKIIRQTSKYLGLVTDASYRYERGVDIEGTMRGVNMATDLIGDLIKNSRASKLYDLRFTKETEKNIIVLPKDVNNLLGTNISQKSMSEYLTRLGFKVKINRNQLFVRTPSYRKYDIKIWQDLAEEIARMYGYTKLPQKQLKKQTGKILNQEYTILEKLKDILTQFGFTETYSYSFASKEILKDLKMFSNNILEIEKPLSPETKYLRPDLLPSLLLQIAKNPWAPEINLYEIGKIFSQNYEKTGLLIATSQNSEIFPKIIQKIENDLKIRNIKYGIFSAKPEVLDKLKIRKKISFCKIDLENLEKRVKNFKYTPFLPKMKAKYQAVSKFAPTIFDLAFIVEKSTNANKIIDEVKKQSQKILLVELFDEFSSDKFGKNQKNIAYHIWAQDSQGPMKENEIKNIRGKIIHYMILNYRAKLRT